MVAGDAVFAARALGQGSASNAAVTRASLDLATCLDIEKVKSPATASTTTCRSCRSARPFFLFRVEVDADDRLGADKAQALDDVEANAAEAEHGAVAGRLDLGGVVTAPIPVVTPQPM